MIKKVPYFADTTLYRCGLTASKMALAYFGVETTEAELVHSLGDSLEQGTYPEKIKELFEKHKIETHLHSNTATFEMIKKYIEDNYLVICLVNRLIYDKKTLLMEAKTARENEKCSAHYIVTYAIENENIYFNDPHEFIGRGVLSSGIFQSSLLGTCIAVKK